MKIPGIQLTRPTPGDMAWAAACIVIVAAALIGAAHQGWIPPHYVWFGTLAGTVAAVANVWGVSATRSLREAALVGAGIFLVFVLADALNLV